jgi:Taurine catabolism dioxygenase TauD, TfdA family
MRCSKACRFLESLSATTSRHHKRLPRRSSAGSSRFTKTSFSRCSQSRRLIIAFRLIRRVRSFLRSFANVRSLRDYLSPHSDNAYFSDAAGLQVLHCINHAGAGGENFLIDGFQVADKIKRERFDVSERLTETVVGVEYRESTHHFRHTAPIINLDPIAKDVMQTMDDRCPQKRFADSIVTS